ncbi:SKN1/KRE6 family beta-glucan synthesis-associated protein SCDLUD_002362 [Saccharomycodes ludwigii]|uniref:SKN1/KRE6 family beta-glucan synthesis-associated protein n=1 Tax=Saccharomycodes ludwigii TaxID=36035 RepID=UPI001E83F1AE|nr:hypothetical protein SCDLUD_002362 [Saccharomycodes ludwigii]KAH3900902.1 hypothetical protein SCDLUD_002362 [Saccharomycodes ludwigii]
MSENNNNKRFLTGDVNRQDTDHYDEDRSYYSENNSSGSNNETNPPQNPFLDTQAYSSSENNSKDSLIRKMKNDFPAINNGEKNNTESSADGVADYKGYYSSKIKANNKNSNAYTRTNNNLLPPSYSSNNIKQSTSYNSLISVENVSSPAAFDRYPMVGSRVASMAGPSHHHHHNNRLHDASSNNSSSSFSSSSQAFLNEQDFSPFGGYPASSFPLLMEEKEDDDYLHNPDPEEEARLDRQRFYLDFKHMDRRSFGGLIGILALFFGGCVIFIILPVLTFTGAEDHGKYTEVINILTLYDYPQLSAIRTSLVDPDTPSDAMAHKAKDGSYWKLAFSDEFNALGRTFYDGDDQFWTAPDLNYKATNDLEWYSPDAATTFNGTLQLRMDAYKSHNLYYRSGMLQSWNKLCFTQGYIEVSANLPNYGRVTGLWPGLWTMGNLGRPGYLASTEGLWPYSYDSCDAGITPNQSSPDGISYLPGQRLSICTCDGEDHPNQGVGRGAPELDILEGEVSTATKGGVGLASQSMQTAPFDIWYMPDYDYIEIYNQSTTVINTYAGGPFQQAVSAVTTLNDSWYEYGPDAGYFQRFGFEYLNDDEDGYVRWFVGETPTYTTYAKALHPNGNIGWRRITKEPMSIILNLGISNNWAYIDWQSIYFPVTLSIDYVRIYQPNDSISITCDPEDYPTYDYIQDHLSVYTDVNLTSWEGAGYTFPKNILTGNCNSSKFSLS